MNNHEWNSSDNAVDMLISLRSYDEQAFKGHVKELQFFYVECCKAQLYLLPQVEFIKGLELAEAYVNKKVSEKEVSAQNWYTEAAVFGMDYDVDTEKNDGIYKGISKKLKLSFGDSKRYAVHLGYFIDWCTLYAQSFNGHIPEKYSEFLVADILKKHISKPFDG